MLVCDATCLADPDLATIGDLARLQLIARRLGMNVVLQGAPRELRDLLDLAGLSEVVACSDPLPVEPQGQPEHREESRSVEEEDDPADPIA